MSPYKITN